MKKLLLFCSIIIYFTAQANEADDLKAQLTSAETELKSFQDEVNLYNQSLPSLNNAKEIINNNNMTIKNITSKIEDLTGIITLSNGSVSYNNKQNSNDILTKLNTTLDQKLTNNTAQFTSEINKQKSIYDSNTQYITGARTTLGDLRIKLNEIQSNNPTDDNAKANQKTSIDEINKNIAFYQDKITNKYLPEQDAAQNAISRTELKMNNNKNTINSQITNNKNTIDSNTRQISIYQTQIDTAKKAVSDAQALIDSTHAKLNATPNKINFNNITMINNNISRLQDTISSLNYQIANLSGTSSPVTAPVAPAATQPVEPVTTPPVTPAVPQS